MDEEWVKVAMPIHPPVHLQDVFTLLKSFYRVILFAPPTDSLALLEQIYITSRRILDLYKSVSFLLPVLNKTQTIFRESIITGNQVSQVIGKWIGCLLFDHVSPVIGRQQFSFLSSSIYPPTFQNLTRRKIVSYIEREKEHVIFFSLETACYFFFRS